MSYLNLTKKTSLTIPDQTTRSQALGWLLISLSFSFSSSFPLKTYAAVSEITTIREVETSNPDGTTSSTTTSTTTSSVPQDVTVQSSSTAEVALTLSLLDSRRFEIDRLIASRLVNGQLTPGQALQLRSKLDHIAALVSAARLSGCSINDPQMIDIAQQLDSVSTEAAGMFGLTSFAPIAVVDRSTGVTRVVVDSFGNIVPVTTVQPDLLLTTLDIRRNELQRLIASGEASGSLDRTLANQFRAELDRLNALENSARASGLTYVSALPIAMQLDYLQDRIVASLPGQKLTPLVVGSRLILTNNQVVVLDDVMVRRADLEGRIATELAAGKLSATQAASLRAQLDDIAKQESLMRANGNLDFKESRQLYTAFDRVGSRLDGYLARR